MYLEETDFINRIKRLRERMVLRNVDIANFLGIAPNTFSNYLHGQYRRKNDLSEKIDLFLSNCERIVFNPENCDRF
jgi:predicted transcriptional regulator